MTDPEERSQPPHPHGQPPTPTNNQKQLSKSTPNERMSDVDARSPVMLLLTVPWCVWSVGIVYWIGALFIDAPWVRTLLGVWLLSGVVMLWLPLEELVARFTFRLRRPVQAEIEKVHTAWRTVTGTETLDTAGCSFWIEESDELSTSTLSGRVITVTRMALTLSAPQFEAALAHEISRHPDGYRTAQAVALWYSLPARAFIWLIKNFGRINRGVPMIGCFVVGFIALSLLGIVLNAVIFDEFPLELFELALFFLAPVGLAWVDRVGERNADKVAAGWGYGPALLEVLNDVHAEKKDGRRGVGVLSSQPGVADRIRSLERYLSRRSS